jgi:hypothetical protein
MIDVQDLHLGPPTPPSDTDLFDDGISMTFPSLFIIFGEGHFPVV